MKGSPLLESRSVMWNLEVCIHSLIFFLSSIQYYCVPPMGLSMGERKKISVLTNDLPLEMVLRRQKEARQTGTETIGEQGDKTGDPK